MKLTPVLNRFGVGFVSAMAVPAIKLVQNGMDMSGWGLVAILGFFIPIVLISFVTGMYAVFVESKETDMKRLFRMCVTLPAFVTMIGSGAPAVDMSVSKAEAKDVEIIICSTKIGLKKGLESSMGMLFNKEYKRYWLLSDEPVVERCVLVEKECKNIVKSVSKMKIGHIYMDKITCKVAVKK